MSSDRAKALDKALKSLARTDRTRAEVVQRLVSLGFTEEVVGDVVAQLDEWGYLDDSRVAKREVDVMAPARGIGKNRIRERLVRRGVRDELAEEALEVVSEETELEKALGLLKKKYRPEDDFGKAGRFLLQRGFDEETVRSALGQHFPAYEEFS